MFTDAEKVDIRRFCGFEAYGSQATQGFGHRYLTHYGMLEYRINNYSAAEEAVIRTTYLTPLYALETAITNSGIGATDNLDTDQAAVWTHNKNEVRDRTRLFDQTRRRLCAFIGIPPGAGLSNGTTRLIV